MKLTVRETAIFAMLGTLMYASKMIMEIAPNIHLIGVFTIAFTVVYRKKALYPVYIFVLLTGLFCVLVDSLFIHMDGFMGICYASPKKAAEKSCARHLYGGLRRTRLFIWHALCPGSCAFVWNEPEGHGCMDYRRAAMGFFAWRQ